MYISTTIMKILTRLIKEKGMVKGVKTAQKLGFSNKQITGSLNNINKKRLSAGKPALGKKRSGGTFKQRKEHRELTRDEFNPSLEDVDVFPRSKNAPLGYDDSGRRILFSRKERRFRPSDREYREMWDDDFDDLPF